MKDTKETLIKKLKAIEDKERKEAAEKIKKSMESLLKERSVTINGNDVQLKFAEDYKTSHGYNPDVVLEFINSEKKHKLVFHDWSGSVSHLNTENAIRDYDLEEFSPIDKGRPGVTVFGSNNYAIFSMAFYEDEHTLWIFNIEEVTAW